MGLHPVTPLPLSGTCGPLRGRGVGGEGLLALAFRLLAAAIALVGFAVRVRGLGVKSLWLDEGLSVDTAGNPIRELFGLLIGQDIHPPLHYVILHYWMGLAGQSEFAVRFPALLTGTLLVPATHVLALALFGGAEGRPHPLTPSPHGRGGRGSPFPVGEGDWGGRSAALLGALLVALSPFLVYYSQEARMYSDLALWGMLSSLALWKWLAKTSPPRPLSASGEGVGGEARSLLAYAATTALALYTHYFAGLVIAFQAVFVGLASAFPHPTERGHARGAPPNPRQDGAPDALRGLRLVAWWLLALVGAGLLYLPWLSGVYWQIRRLATSPDFWKGELSLAFIVEKVFTAFALGKSGVPVRSLPLIALAALLFGAGLILLIRRGLLGRRGDLFALLYLLVPLLALYAISARNPKFTERYLIMIAPVFYLIVARALVALAEAGGLLRRRWAGGVWASRCVAGIVALLALGASVGELQRVYAGPGYEKDDNRAAAAYIQAHEQPGDVIVSMMDTEHVLKYYYHGQLPRHGLHPGDDVVTAAANLNRYLAGKRRLWLLLWQEDWADPTGFVRDSLDAHLTRLPGPGEYQGLKLILYAIDQSVAFSADLTPRRAIAVNFDDALTFLGYDPPPQPVAAGGRAELTLYWQARKPLSQDYVASLRLSDGSYRWVRQDQRPAAYTYPTTSWRVGRTVRGRIALPVPLGTPPGDYDLELVVYPQETHKDLNVLDASGRPVAPRATIGRLTVARPTGPVDPARLSIPRPLDERFGQDLRLLGTDLSGESVRPGASFDLALFWQALGATRGDDLVSLTVVDAAGQSASLAEARPAGGRYPTPGWQDGEVVVDRYHLVVPPSAAPGPASLLLGLKRLPGREALAATGGEQVLLATLKVGERPRVGQRPTDVQHELDLRLGDVATLIGYSLRPDRARPGGELALTLYWEARGSSEVGYTVFTHLLDEQSRIWGQQDGIPGGGSNPTTGWLPGEYVRDEYRLQIKPDAPPGEYELEVGMYDPQTGARLKVAGPGGEDQGDRIVLQKIQVQ